MATSIPPDGPILEVGCGGGAFMSELQLLHPRRSILGIDANPIALDFNKPVHGDVRHIAQADLHNLPFPDSKLSAVVGLDAYDQNGIELASALEESWRVLGTSSVLLVRVSAYEWLWGEHDRAFGTAKRYTKASLEQALLDAKYSVIRMTHANTVMLLPAIIHRLTSRMGWTTVEEQLELPKWLNSFLTVILGLETAWLRRKSLPMGLSLYALARKTT